MLASRRQRVVHLLIFVSLLFAALNAGQLETVRAQVPAKPQQATVTLDGVQLSIQASALPSGSFTAAEPGSASQVATSASWKPFSEFTITAIPFGSKAGTEALPAAEPS